MRIMHACLHSVINPLAFGTVADYFPQNQRARANSFLQSANFLGMALCSFSIII
jgi:MFS family permease